MHTNKLKILIRYLSGLPKSIYVNFRLLPLSQAIKLPIIVSRRTILSSLRGKVHLTKVKTGILRFGFGNVERADYIYNRNILHIDGHLHIKGKCKIGMGSKLLVMGELHLGENFLISSEATIICNKKIVIGQRVSLAWESVIMDNDQHKIFDKNKNIINHDKEIILGNDVWLGARSMILKGTHIANGVIIGANTTITKSIHKNQVIVAGPEQKILKENITWQR